MSPPRIGQPITFDGREIGHVTAVVRDVCYVRGGGDHPVPFLWRESSRHSWPTKEFTEESIDGTSSR